MTDKLLYLTEAKGFKDLKTFVNIVTCFSFNKVFQGLSDR